MSEERIIYDCLAEVGRLENIDDLPSDVEAQRDSLSFVLKETRKLLRDVEDYFFWVTVDKKSLVK